MNRGRQARRSPPMRRVFQRSCQPPNAWISRPSMTSSSVAWRATRAASAGTRDQPPRISAQNSSSGSSVAVLSRDRPAVAIHPRPASSIRAVVASRAAR